MLLVIIMPKPKAFTLVIDFETANVASTSACALGLVVLDEYKIIHTECFMIRPPTQFFAFTHIHGLTWNDVKDAPTFGEIWKSKLEKWFDQSSKLVAHNIGFDFRVLTNTALHYGIELKPIRRECTVKISKNDLRIYPANLKSVSDHLGIELNHHEAMSDAMASAYIYIHAKTGEKPWQQKSLFEPKSNPSQLDSDIY